MVSSLVVLIVNGKVPVYFKSVGTTAAGSVAKVASPRRNVVVLFGGVGTRPLAVAVATLTAIVRSAERSPPPVTGAVVLMRRDSGGTLRLVRAVAALARSDRLFAACKKKLVVC